ncbi:retrovirus-related pol polyprotein from transposon TNT 1-94 [Tanacetum coccineum]
MLKKLIEKCKGKSVETQFDKPSVVRQQNTLRIPKLSVLGKLTTFSDSLERKSFSKTKLVTKTNVSEGVIHRTSVSRPQLRSIQMKDKVMPNNCQVKFKKTEGNITINRVYYVKGLNNNLFSVGQFCDADLEVAFWKSTCFVRDLQGNDLITGNRGSDLCTISLQESTSITLICFMAKASPTQAWLWHRRLSHLNFDYINLVSKKDIMIGLTKLKYVKDQLCSSCELKSINGKKYILVIVDDYSRYTYTLFLRSKDETLEVLKDFLKMIQRNLQAQMITIRTVRGTKFLKKTMHAYFKEEGIEHQTSTPRTPKQNDIVER